MEEDEEPEKEHDNEEDDVMDEEEPDKEENYDAWLRHKKLNFIYRSRHSGQRFWCCFVCEEAEARLLEANGKS
jgi:hypothetical protein